MSRLTNSVPVTSPLSRILGRIYIYCGPCACAIQTALKLTRDNDASGFFDFTIRIDERLPTSCRRSTSIIDVLGAIRDTIVWHEVKSSLSSSVSMGFFDCLELERRIYNLEQEPSGLFQRESILQKILAAHGESLDDDDGIPVHAIIFIAEADLCHFSLESHPFHFEPRKPRATDIFAFTPYWDRQMYTWQRKYMSSYCRSDKAMEKNKTRLSPFTGPIPSPTSEIVTSTSPILDSKRPRSQSTAGSDV